MANKRKTDGNCSEIERGLSAESVLVAATGQVSADLADGSVILNLKDGVYYGLNGVGGRIWSLIQEPRRLGDLCDALLEEYDVEPDCCEHELFALIQRLIDEGLVEVKDEANP